MRVEFADEVAGVYFRSIVLPKVGDKAEQHIHPYDHATLCGSGAAKLYMDGRYERTVRAGEAALVKKNIKHHFVATMDDTRLICVHIAESAQAAQKVALLEHS